MKNTIPFIFLSLFAYSCIEYDLDKKEKEPEVPIEDSEPYIEPPPELPVAVCDVSPNPITPPFETATWDGSQSYDPSGREIVEYDWELIEMPRGSTSIMPAGNNAIVGGFIPDLAGNYIGQLTVRVWEGDESEPCIATLESIPAEDLWIEMYWTNSGDDMDLHLLAPSGSLTSNTDCYYANCVSGGLDWGERGVLYDNPSLDLDDIPGTGPENINIEAPENGEYTVYVHDYPGSVFNGVNSVTVNVYMNGSMVWTDTRQISGENDYTPFARIQWEDGIVVSL